MITKELLNEVSKGAWELAYKDEVKLEDLKDRLSPEVYELLKRAREEFVEPFSPFAEPQTLHWDEVAKLYRTGYFAYSLGGEKNKEAAVRFWYLKKDGTIDFFEVSSERVLTNRGFEDRWTPEALESAAERIEKAVNSPDTHPLSAKALSKELENWKERLKEAVIEEVKKAVPKLSDEILITLPSQWTSAEYDLKGYEGDIPGEKRIDGIVAKILEEKHGSGFISSLYDLFSRGEVWSWIYYVAQEEAERRGLAEDRLYEIDEWPVGNWRKGPADLGLQGQLEVEGIYYDPDGNMPFLLAKFYLEPEALKEQGWLSVNSAELKKLEEVYSQFAERRIGLEEYLNALKPYLPEDFDFGAVELRKHSYGQNALYPVVYFIRGKGELGPLIAEGRRAYEWIAENIGREEDYGMEP
jgi:hypothetical protein